MTLQWRFASRLLAGLLTAALFFGLDVGLAIAQSASCAQLGATLQQLNRNADFRNSSQTNDNLRALQSDERNAESAYIRTGCQRDQQQGYPQTPECRAYARQILQDRAQLQQMSQSVASGNSVAQQREQVLQEIARFGCSQDQSQARFSGDYNPQPRRHNFLEDLFGGFTGRSQGQDNYGDSGTYNGQEQVDDPYADQHAGNTIRTVCVRMSDGYYWPVSYSTVRDYIPQDTQTCQQECPGQQVGLYFYDNPGQDPEQMVNASGQAYTALASAFAYRKAFDLTNTCKAQVTGGQITLQSTASGQSRAMVSYDGATFPLPLRDPRRAAQATTLPARYAAIVDVPLPRPRPAPAGTAPVVAPTAGPVVSDKNRTVKVGDKIVRVVGPDTPYAPATLASPSG